MHISTPQQQARSRRRGSLLVRVVAATALTLGAVGLAAAPPASADLPGAYTVTFLAPGNGIVGVPQRVNFLMDGVQPTFTVTAQSPNWPATSFSANYYGGGNGSFIWTPPHVGVWTFTVPDANYVSASTSIGQVGTTTTVVAPNSVKIGVPTTITAKVVPANGSQLAPLGQIQFATVGGGNIGAPVWLNGGSPSQASIQWTPAVLGTTVFTATYTPYSVNGVTDTTCGSSCTSAPDSIQVTSTGTTMYLANPGQLYQGTPATLTAVVTVTPPNGWVTFSVNGSVVAANSPVQANGQATASWTPPAPGAYSLTAKWTGTGGQTSTATDTLNVAAGQPQGDSIVVVTQNGTALVPNNPYTAANGTSFTFTAKTASGAAVALTQSGPCSISGNVFTVTQGNGQCRVTASSPGGNGYSAASVTYIANLVPGTQTAKLKAPASGNINVGKTVTLETPSQGTTNAGQPISWKITSGKNTICKLSFPSDGSVKLKMVKKGTCKVQANAKAVSGQWNAFQLNRTYKGV